MMDKKNAWETYSETQLQEVMELGEEYRRFISENKTERECAAAAVDMARRMATAACVRSSTQRRR